MATLFRDDQLEIYCGDCVRVMADMAAESVDLTVTSPPYDNLRTYKGYSFDFTDVANGIYRVTKQGGVVVWVVSDATIKGSETGSSFRQALYFKDIGFNLHDTMIYSRGAQGGAKGSCYCYTQSFEYMFVLSKGRPSAINLLRDRKNSYKYVGEKSSTMRKANGNTYAFSTKNNEFSKRSNVWEMRGGYMVGSSDIESFRHPASFPEALAKDHILSWSREGDLVLDPMCGSGTTLKMALLNQRRAIGIDISKEYCALSVSRCLRAQSGSSKKGGKEG